MAKYRVTCEHCDLNIVFDDARPAVECIERGRVTWSAKSAAAGAVAGHASNYDHGKNDFHKPTVERVATKLTFK